MVITSIIIFNGGAAGDFLKAICVEQLLGPKHVLDGNGMIDFDHHHLKDVTESWYTNKNQLMIDYNKLCTVENTHYYLDWYPHVCENIYYIDYCENLQYKILEAVKKKRHKDSWSNFLQDNKVYLPSYFQDKVTEKDVINVFAKRWNRNLIGWRSNLLITPIPFLDLFEIEKIIKIIETINKQPCQDIEIIKKTHAYWLKKIRT
jgi:hypothetical protein